jgi:hypothetical protein
MRGGAYYHEVHIVFYYNPPTASEDIGGGFTLTSDKIVFLYKMEIYCHVYGV